MRVDHVTVQPGTQVRMGEIAVANTGSKWADVSISSFDQEPQSDIELARRQMQIRETMHAAPELQAECAVIGHSREHGSPRCFYCGAKME